MELRSQSISPKFEVNFVCGHCNETQPEEIDMRNFDIQEKEDHINPIQVNDSTAVVMGYPTAEVLMEIGKAEQEMDIYHASASCIEEIHTKVKKTLEENIIQEIPILYGGSVNSSNSKEILNTNNVDGVLVGGASTKIDQLLGIVNSI